MDKYNKQKKINQKDVKLESPHFYLLIILNIFLKIKLKKSKKNFIKFKYLKISNKDITLNIYLCLSLLKIFTK